MPFVRFRPALLGAVCAALACGGEPPVADTATPPAAADTATLEAASVAIAGFTYATVERAPWRAALRASGRVVPDPVTTTPIGAVVDGRVVEVRVQPGDRVAVGTVLATIHTHEMMDARRDLASALAQRQTAAAQSEQATRERARTERLLALRAAGTQDVERAVATERAALAALADAEGAVTRAEGLVEHLLGDGDLPADLDPHLALVRATRAGVVLERSVQPGLVVLMGAPLFTIASDAALVVEVGVPETGLAAAQVGATLRFRVPAFPTDTFTARVVRVAPGLDTLTRLTTLWASPSTGAGRLRAGMVAQAELQGAPDAETTVVPAGAVQAMEGDTVLIVAEPKPDGSVLLRAQPVRIGRRSGPLAEVLDGLTAGAQVVVQGAAIAKAELLKRRGAFDE
jgi:membrane fusion protein, heavy metal efflux system